MTSQTSETSSNFQAKVKILKNIEVLFNKSVKIISKHHQKREDVICRCIKDPYKYHIYKSFPLSLKISINTTVCYYGYYSRNEMKNLNIFLYRTYLSPEYIEKMTKDEIENINEIDDLVFVHPDHKSHVYCLRIQAIEGCTGWGS